MKEPSAVTEVLCQQQGIASYEFDIHIETFVLRSKFSAIIRHQIAITKPKGVSLLQTWGSKSPEYLFGNLQC